MKNGHYDLVNLSNSILKKYGLETYHDSIPELDEILSKHDKIAIFLFDGAGEAILNKHPHSSSFALKHQKMVIKSVNPATTVAATTSLLTGKYPVETGYLGWTLQFDEYNDAIFTFRHKKCKNDEALPEDVMLKKCPNDYLYDMLNEHGVKAARLMKQPADPNGQVDLKDGLGRANEFFKNGGEFLYYYDNEPDHCIHTYGTNSPLVAHKLYQCFRMLRRFIKANPDVLVISLADHGLIDCKTMDMAEHKDLTSLLNKPVSIEGRTPAFFVTPGKEEEFRSLFEKYYGDYFELMSKREVLVTEYFGKGEPRKETLEFIGSFIGVSTSNVTLYNSSDRDVDFYISKAHHAGTSKDEMNIILSIYNE
ncbi:MAG: hypothetical protein MJ238_05290 [Bacilli bacterium]|nr:hypothetical protein [Bacilli bacterium]